MDLMQHICGLKQAMFFSQSPLCTDDFQHQYLKGSGHEKVIRNAREFALFEKKKLTLKTDFNLHFQKVKD